MKGALFCRSCCDVGCCVHMPPTGFRIPARLAISHGNRLCHPRGGAQGCRIHLPTLWKSPHPCAQHILLLFQHCVLLPGLRRGVALHTQRRRAGITPHVLPEPQSACPAKRGRRFHVRHTVTPQRPALHIPAPARGRNRGFPA